MEISCPCPRHNVWRMCHCTTETRLPRLEQDTTHGAGWSVTGPVFLPLIRRPMPSAATLRSSGPDARPMPIPTRHVVLRFVATGAGGERDATGMDKAHVLARLAQLVMRWLVEARMVVKVDSAHAPWLTALLAASPYWVAQGGEDENAIVAHARFADAAFVDTEMILY